MSREMMNTDKMHVSYELANEFKQAFDKHADNPLDNETISFACGLVLASLVLDRPEKVSEGTAVAVTLQTATHAVSFHLTGIRELDRMEKERDEATIQ